MKNLLIILLICTFSSCFLWKPSAEKVRREAIKDSIAADKACMDSLKAFVAKNWTYHQDGNYYSYTNTFREHMGEACISIGGIKTKGGYPHHKYDNSLSQLNYKGISDLFGLPSKVLYPPLQFYYYLEPNCKSIDNCALLSIKFDDDGKFACAMMWL
jgi:hypothetical protein